MDSTIFDTLIAACREIIEEEELPQRDTEEQSQPQIQAESMGVGEESSGQEEWQQFENAIANHIKIKNSKATDPIILIEESSEEEEQKPTDTHSSKDLEDTQGECDHSKTTFRTTPPLKFVCKAPEVKATRPLSRAKAKKIARLNKSEEMSREVRCKVNIEELKEKIIQPTKQSDSAMREQKQTLKTVSPSPMKAHPTQTNVFSSKKFGEERISHANSNNDEGSESGRGKVAKKGGKNDRPEKPVTPMTMGSINVAALSLDEVVGYCRVKNLISDEFYIEYVAASSEDNISYFIDLFIKNNLRLWNFDNFKITIMDHRRLAEYLVRVSPHEFKIGTPYNANPNVKDFLENLYGLNQQKYRKLLESLDAESKVAEWKTVRAICQNYAANTPQSTKPTPIAIIQGKAPFKRPANSPGQLPTQTIKTASNLKPANDREKKRMLSAVYEEQGQPYREMEMNEHEMRLNSLKNQLKKKKVG